MPSISNNDQVKSILKDSNLSYAIPTVVYNLANSTPFNTFRFNTFFLLLTLITLLQAQTISHLVEQDSVS